MISEDLDALIDQLEHRVTAHLSGVTNWKEVWGIIRLLDFKSARYPSREAHQAAWDRKQGLVEQVRALQNADFALRQQFGESSAKHLRTIQSMADDGKPDGGDLVLALVTGGLSLIFKRVMDDIFGETDEVREELERRSNALREAGWYLRDHKTEMKRADKDVAFGYIGEIRERLDHDWDEWKRAKAAAHGERQRQWEDKQREYSEKHDRWVKSQNDFIDILEEKIERFESILEGKRNNLDKLQDMLTSARGDHVERVESWIDECESSISDLESKIESAQDKIREVKDKLNEN